MRLSETQREVVSAAILRYTRDRPCPACGGAPSNSLNPDLVSVPVWKGDKGIPAAAVACNLCGFVSLHALKALGLENVAAADA